MWFDEVIATRAPPLVEAILVLLANGQRWRHRRVETLTPVSAAFVRRRISIDFTVPEQLHDGLRLGEAPRWLVPLGWLARRQLVNFDLRSPADEPMPVLLGQQTAQLTADLLTFAAASAGLDPADRAVAAEASEVIDLAAAEGPIADADALVHRARGLGLDEQFASLVAASARGFLLLAVVPRPVAGQRGGVPAAGHHARGPRRRDRRPRPCHRHRRQRLGSSAIHGSDDPAGRQRRSCWPPSPRCRGSCCASRSIPWCARSSLARGWLWARPRSA